MFGFSGIEILMLLMVTGGQANDLVSHLSPHDYFKSHGIEISAEKMVELAANEPVSGKAQIGQLLALRALGEDAEFKKGPNFPAQRRIIEQIAAGQKGRDKLGFAAHHARRALAHLEGKQPAAAPPPGARAEALAWFPPSATIVMGLQTGGPSTSSNLKGPVAELLKQMPAPAKSKFYEVIDGLGNVQVEGLSFAFVEGTKPEGSRIFLRFTGRYNQDWVRQTLKALGVDGKERPDAAGKSDTFVIADPNAPYFALIGDSDLLIAGGGRGGGNEAIINQALMLREKKGANASNGALKGDLEGIPAKALGYLVGELPGELRQNLEQALGASPKKVIARLERTDAGMDSILEARMEDEAQAKTLVKAGSKLRMDALDSLPKLEGVVPGLDVGILRNTLNSIQMEARGSSVHVRLLISDETLKMVPRMFVRVPVGG